LGTGYFCGYCAGPISENVCQTTLGPKGMTESNCPRAVKFRISSAANTEKKSCTNVPARCPFRSCGNSVHWKYNFPQHFHDAHPDYEIQLTEEHRQRLIIPRQEQLGAGIPEAYAVEWPPQIPIPSTTSHLKRTVPTPPKTPSRREKENQPPRKVARTK
jgi:hypothetical protein